MVMPKCPLCDSPCIIKIIATEDDRWKEVDVCKMCGTMYPRDKPTKGRKAGRAKKKQSK